ncbi:filamentous hemagglutinin N-terminal domain-containing protein [Leclercia adecarboxylata]|uniref:two-partner secretion domain-containing protein n=1 Tax=Leclercia adecarboxylata TaxID=83655 RepID=UPI00254D2E44|nr:filamentous hemagglutinin N-terminal domain-containing protein [Leclercia adecarboxylata]
MKHYENKCRTIKLNPIAASLLLFMPVMAQASDIAIINGSISSATNGVPVININEANAKGLSHNVYESLNVGKEGLIFNNAANSVKTQLGGDIAGNPKLAGGTAKVILNEVTSKNASTINGMMEVAGDAAHLIIANPNGITTKGGSVVNATKATLTTGTPTIKDGALTGYTVNGGTITVGGLQSESPTEILARSVKVIGSIQVGELAVVAGNNTLDANGTVTGRSAASGAASSYGVDVAQLGGMYANKISLISTEGGMGVRNMGTISGGDNGVSITSNGQLINSKSTITSNGDIAITTKGTLENTSGKIASNKTIYISTAKNAIINKDSGNISSAMDNYISSGAVDNTNGKLAAGGTLALNTNKQKLTNSGKAKNAGIEAVVVALDTGEFDNRNGKVSGYYVGMKNTAFNNQTGAVDSYGDVNIESTGDINNEMGLLRSSVGAVKLKSDAIIKNNNSKSADTTGAESLGILSGNGLDISAKYIYNKSGMIASSKDIKLQATGIDNYQGRIESSGNISIKGGTFQTSQSNIVGVKGVSIDVTDDFTNRIGVVSSTEGDVLIKAKSIVNSNSIVLGENINIESGSDLDNKYSMIVADKSLGIKAAGNIDTSGGDKFGYYAGQFFGFANQIGGIIGGTGVNITAYSLNNDNSRVVAHTGDISINLSGNLAGYKSQVAANDGNVKIKAGRINADYSTIYSSNDLNIDATSLSVRGDGAIANNTATGIIAADNDILININGDFNNNGWISGKGNVNVTSTASLNNYHTINADRDLTVKANYINNNKDIVARNNLTVTSDNDVTNTYKGNITAYNTNVNAKNVSNRGNIIADARLALTVSNNIYNYRNIYTDGQAVMSAKKIMNTGFWAVLGGASGFQKPTSIINIFGQVVGK